MEWNTFGVNEDRLHFLGCHFNFDASSCRFAFDVMNTVIAHEVYLDILSSFFIIGFSNGFSVTENKQLHCLLDVAFSILMLMRSID